jgi:hypothetical protein
MEFEDLKGKTLSKIVVVKDDREFNDSVIFEVIETNIKYKLFHDQSCCEQVNLEEIIGDLEDLVGVPILLAEEVISNNDDGADMKEGTDIDDSWTWSFYKLSTIKGSVTLRWYGTSNGYYSETVDFVQI